MKRLLAVSATLGAMAASVAGPEVTQQFGFVNFIKLANNKLVAAVVLQGATPNAVYNIRLIQVLPGDSDCPNIDGTLTTDSSGDGSANVQEPVLQGATSAWVDLNNQADLADFYDTAVLSF